MTALTPDLPAWLTDLGNQTDALVRKNPDRFATMIERWAESLQRRWQSMLHKNLDAIDAALANAKQRDDQQAKHFAKSLARERRRLCAKPDAPNLNECGPFALLERGEELTLEDTYAVVAAVHAATLPSFAGRWGGHDAAFEFPDDVNDADVTMDTHYVLPDPVARKLFLLSRHVAYSVNTESRSATIPRTSSESLLDKINVCFKRVEGDLADGVGRAKPSPGKGTSQEQTNALVKHWLAENVYSDAIAPEDITIKMISNAIGSSTGAICKSPPWKAFEAQRRQEKKERRQTMTEKHIEDASEVAYKQQQRQEELERLIGEQADDEQSDTVHIN